MADRCGDDRASESVAGLLKVLLDNLLFLETTQNLI